MAGGGGDGGAVALNVHCTPSRNVALLLLSCFASMLHFYIPSCRMCVFDVL